MIYMFKLYDLEELKDFDIFRALEMISDSSGVDEFGTMEEVESHIKMEFDSGNTSYINEPEYIAIVDVTKKKIIKKTYTLDLKVKTFKSDEAIQKQMDLESKKAKEIQKKRDAEYAKIQKERSMKK